MGLTHFSSTYTIERQITKNGENLRETDHLEDQGVDKRIILKRFFTKEGGGRGLDLSGSTQGQATGTCERGVVNFSRTLRNGVT